MKAIKKKVPKAKMQEDKHIYKYEFNNSTCVQTPSFTDVLKF